MKRNKLLHTLIMLTVVILSACNNDIAELTSNSSNTRTMYFNIEFSSYDDAPSTRANKTIPNGAKLYIYFKGESNTIQGTAVYNSSSSSWTLSYEGQLPSGSNSCEVYYIEKEKSSTAADITLDLNSAMFYTTSGTYSNTKDMLTVKAALKPLLSRVRFKGSSGTSIKISGIKYVTKFALSSKTLSTSTSEISLSVGSSGYTPYIYYKEPSESLLTLVYDKKTYTVKSPLTSNGLSGYVTIPTTDALAGWTYKKIIDPNGHEYVDLGLSVKWATCDLGSTSIGDEYAKYYAWGEVTGGNEYPTKYSSTYTGQRNPDYTPYELKTSYSWKNYKWGTSEVGIYKYNKSDGLTTLTLEDDAAHYNWGGSWRMPTYQEMAELIEKCYWTWKEQNGIKGYIVRGDNGNSIFLYSGYYWTSSLDRTWSNTFSQAGQLEVDNGVHKMVRGYRCYPYIIRPVLE